MPILYDVAAKHKHNLSIETNAANPTYQVDVNADELALISPAGQKLLLDGINETIDITVAGLGGLDTGSEGGSVIYYIWIISNGTLVSGLLSLSASSPTMPGGYAFKRLVGEVYNDATPNFVPFHRYDDWNFFKAPVNVFSNVTATTTRQSASMPSELPSGVSMLDFGVGSVSANRLATIISYANSADFENIFLAVTDPDAGNENGLSMDNLIRNRIIWFGGLTLYYKRAVNTDRAAQSGYIYGYKLAR